MTSLGRVCQLVVTNNATFDGSVYVFKNAGTYYLLGAIRAGERKVFPINVVQSGINNGDDIRARVLSSQGADHTDTNIVTYVSNAGNQGEYVITGTAGNPNISIQSVNNIGGGGIPPPPTDRRVSRGRDEQRDFRWCCVRLQERWNLLSARRHSSGRDEDVLDQSMFVQIRGRVLSSQGADNTDETLVTYVSNANNEARYTIEGTASNPKMRFVLVAGIV